MTPVKKAFFLANILFPRDLKNPYENKFVWVTLRRSTIQMLNNQNVSN